MRDLILLIHLFAAVTWIGGIVFLFGVSPVFRGAQSAEALPLLRQMNRRFRDISWIAVGVLLITGTVNLMYWIQVRYDGSLGLALAENAYLSWKLGLVGAMVLVKVLHDFVIGPRAGRNPDNRLLWNTAVTLGRLNLVLAIALLYVSLQL